MTTPDASFPEPKIHRPHSARGIRKPFWDVFLQERAEAIFRAGGRIIDIGGGMRIDPARGNRVNPLHVSLFSRFLSDPAVEYRVTDYTDRYHPDDVEDIHRLSFDNDSVDGLFCIAVLEHVYDPKQATEEVVRVLKRGGRALLYLPFLYRYHAKTSTSATSLPSLPAEASAKAGGERPTCPEWSRGSEGDYKDYYRYTRDGIAYFFRTCADVELCPVRGLSESLLRFTPLHRIGFLRSALRWVDWSTEKMRSLSERQTSGYFVSVVK